MNAYTLDVDRLQSSAAIVLAIVTLGAAGCSSVTPDRSVETQVRVLLPAFQVTFEADAVERDAPYGVRTFAFVSTPAHEWPYGTGFAVVDRIAGEVLWVHLHDGDYPPHEIRWADFDGDGRDDIFFHAGAEDVFTTYLYMNRVTSRRYALSHFALAYENEAVYAAVVDFDGDDRPELLAPEPYPADDDPCFDTFHALSTSMSEWKDEYRHVAKRFDPFNFPAGEAAELDALQLFSKIEIVDFGPRADPSAVLRHLRVRRNLITATIPALAPPCRSRAEEIDEHLAQLIRKYGESND